MAADQPGRTLPEATRRLARLVVVALLVALVLPGSALGASITVNTVSDVTALNGACTLREAITAANTDTSTADCPRVGAATPDVVVVPANASPYSLTGAAVDDANLSGDLDITDDVKIIGAGAASTLVHGGQHDRVFDVHSGTTVELRDLTVTGGKTPTPADASPGTDHSGDPNTPGTGPNGANAASGGGILSLGTLTLTRVTVIGNATGDGGRGGDSGHAGNGLSQGGASSTGGNGGNAGSGGGIAANGGSLTVIDSTISNNSSGHGGMGGAGGAGGNGDTSAVDGFSGGNSSGGGGGAAGDGGGISLVNPSASLTMSGSTVSGNVTGAGGRGGDGGQAGNGGTAGSGRGGSGAVSFGGPGLFGGFGGGVSVGPGSNVNITDSTIRANHTGAGGTGGDGGHGGNGGPGSNPLGAGGNSIGGGGQGGGQGGGLLLSATNESLTGVTISGNGAGAGGDGGAGGTGGVGDASGASTGGAGATGGLTGGLALLNAASPGVSNTTIALNVAGAGGHGGAGGGGPNGSQSGDGGQGGSDAGLFITDASSALINHATIASNAVAPGGLAGDPGTAPHNVGSAGVAGVHPGLTVTAGTIERNTIVASNGVTNCSGPFSGASSGDLVFPAADATCPADVKADPLLGPLQSNGGPTFTMALGASSPAIDAVTSGCLSTDQRGISRPKGAQCDIGAFERALPSAVTGGSSAVTPAGATVAGSVNPNERPTTYRFQYGKTTAYGTQTAVGSAGTGATSVAKSAHLTGLSPNTTYHYRIFAANGDGTSNGADHIFKTLPPFTGVKIGAKPVIVDKKGNAPVKVSCPAGTTGSCTGALTLTAKARLKGKVKTFILGPVHFTIAAGKTVKVKLKLSKSARNALATTHQLKATASAVSHDGFGTTRTTSGKVTLKPAKKKKKKHA